MKKEEVPKLKKAHDHKADDYCEGCEWGTFQDWFESDIYIRQVQVELHPMGKIGVNPRIHEFFNYSIIDSIVVDIS